MDTGCWCRKIKQGDYLENVGVNWKILKRMLKNMVGRAQTGLIYVFRVLPWCK